MNDHSHAYELPVLHTECDYQDVELCSSDDIVAIDLLRNLNHKDTDRILTKKVLRSTDHSSITNHDHDCSQVNSILWESELKNSSSIYENLCDLCGYVIDDDRVICDRCQKVIAAEKPIDPSNWNDQWSNYDQYRHNKVSLHDEQSERYKEILIDSEEKIDQIDWNEQKNFNFSQKYINRLSDHLSDRINRNFDNEKFFTRNDQIQSVENIYENICDQCGLIYSGDQCTNCREKNQKRKSDPEKRSQLNIFTGFIDAFKQKSRGSKERSKSKRKIEIIHNVDNVFKTNKSFDMNEICRLKLELKASESSGEINTNKNNDSSKYTNNTNNNNNNNNKNSIYGKLRLSDEYLLSRSSNKNIIPPDGFVIKSSTSESNFAQSQQATFPVLAQSTPDLIDHRPYHQEHDPIYENLEIINESSCLLENIVEPLQLPQQQLQSHRPFDDIIKDSHSYSSSTISSVLEWMTSLRTHTETYDPDHWYNVKCIPSRCFDCNSTSYNWSLLPIISRQKLVKCRESFANLFNDNNCLEENGEIMNESSIECVREVERFKVANHSKRKAIYLKDEKHLEPMFVILQNNLRELRHDLKNSDCNRRDEKINNDLLIEPTELIDYNEMSILRPKNKHFETILLSEDTVELSNQIVPHRSIVQDQKMIVQSKKKNQNPRKMYFARLSASTSLNRIIICYDKKLKTFINNFNLINFGNNDLEAIFRQFYHQQSFANKITQKKSKLTDFEKPTQASSGKDFNDFECKRNTGADQSIKRLEDFEKQVPSPQLLKMLGDFEWKQKTKQLVPLPPPRDVAIRPPEPIRKRQTESIYQPIWIFQTIGYAKEPDPGDNDGSYYECSDSLENIDFPEWEVAEEFSYATEFKDENLDEFKDSLSEPFNDPYQSVCILYNVDDPKYNKMIYQSEKTVECKQNNVEIGPENVWKSKNWRYSRVFEKTYDTFDSVKEWQKMLKSMYYTEDEEDVNLIIDDFLTTKTFESVSYGTETIPLKLNSQLSNSWKNDSDHEEQTKKLNQSTDPQVNKKEPGFLSKLQSGRIDISKNTFWANDEIKTKNNTETFFQLNFDSGEPPIVQKKPIGYLTYGVTLDELEKHDQYPSIPKFVVECIRIIEEEENIKTSGIYRASGKKESIDKVKKKMDEKSKKSSKYSILKTEDIHTITGALKQFFRELKTELIPIQLVRNMPNDLEFKENFNAIVQEINKIQKSTKDILQFLLEHLIRVDQHNEYNLMTASNLSIVWGACLFTSSVTDADLFETTELIKKNTLVKILIQRYKEVFDEDWQKR